MRRYSAADPRREAAAAAMSGTATLGGEAEVVMGGGGGRDGSGSGGGGDDDERPGCRAFGPALEAVLTWLGAEGVDSTDSGAPGGGPTGSAGELRHPSVGWCRVKPVFASTKPRRPSHWVSHLKPMPCVSLYDLKRATLLRVPAFSA